MKTRIACRQAGLFLIAIGFVMCNYVRGQITCIYCYEQNARVSTGVNNLMLNGGFENGTCVPYGQQGHGSFCSNSIFYSCNVADWTCTGGGSSTHAGIYDGTSSAIAEGNQAVYFGNNFCNACSSAPDDTSCLSNILCTTGGVPAGYPRSGPYYGMITGVSLQQTVTGLITGNIYVLEFWAGGNFDNMLFFDNGLFSVDVGFGKTFLSNKPTPPDSGIGTRYIIEFMAASSSHTITFTSWGHICWDCTELVLDDVRLYTIGELSSAVPPCITNINALDKNAAASVYPNPFTTELNIILNSGEPSQLILYNVLSQKFLEQSFTNSASVNTSQLPDGVYFYEVRNKTGVIEKGKVVKE